MDKIFKLTFILTGETGLDGTDLLPKASRAPITDRNTILVMRDSLLAQPKGTPWVVATGTLTNVALLFATFPEVVDHIQGLSLMGGAIGNGFTDAPMSRIPGEKSRIGNVTPWAEFNIYVCFSSLGAFRASTLVCLTQLGTLV
jgi:uridine nucleosidase